MVGFVSSPRFIEHIAGPNPPERPDRIRAIHRAVRDAGLIDSPDPFPDSEINLGIKKQNIFKLKEFSPALADEKFLRLVHSEQQIEFVKHMCAIGGILDQDTPVSPNSYEIALLSLGSALRAADAVMKGEVVRAFSAASPRGHHAEPEKSMGFCIFSNIAIAAKYVQQ